MTLLNSFAPPCRRTGVQSCLRGLLLSFLVATGAAIFAPQSMVAYVQEGQSWSAGSTVTFQMALGSAGRTLSDGNTSWDVAAAPASLAWNQNIQRLNFVQVPNASTSRTSGDGINSVFFASTYFGHSFGSSTLAVTYYSYSGGRILEADVVFNNH